MRFQHGFPAGDRFVFEFPNEASARSYFNHDPESALAVLQKWGCSAAVARIKNQSDVSMSLELFMAMTSKSR